MSSGGIKLLLVCSAVVLFVLLFIAPKTAPKSEAEPKPAGLEVSENATVEVYLNMASKTIEPAQKQLADSWVSDKQFDSLTALWTRRKRPDLASFYSEQIAKETNAPRDWFNAGNRYYYAVQFTQDKTEIPVLYQSSMRCFKKGLVKDPTNTDAKIMLASCYVEGSGDPMQGITMLREIEQADSNNVKLQLSFAFFSVKSGQLDKAISRFKKVLEVDSNYIEAYLHLADAYSQLNENEKAIGVLQKYASKTPDITAKMEVGRYIEQLKEIK